LGRTSEWTSEWGLHQQIGFVIIVTMAKWEKAFCALLVIVILGLIYFGWPREFLLRKPARPFDPSELELVFTKCRASERSLIVLGYLQNKGSIEWEVSRISINLFDDQDRKSAQCRPWLFKTVPPLKRQYFKISCPLSIEKDLRGLDGCIEPAAAKTFKRCEGRIIKASDDKYEAFR
jgi:hypothetical protein